MTKDEYVKTLEKRATDEVADIIHDNYCDGYVDGLKKAIDLAEELDEPKKVVIPKFIAIDIKYHKNYGSTLRDVLGSTFDQNVESDVYCWFFADDGDENFMKYISAWSNGYEVEKPKYGVIVKGLGVKDECLILSSDSNYFFLGNRKIYSRSINTFTKQYLADNWSEYDAYNNAGLLEFEEVEDEQNSKSNS